MAYFGGLRVSEQKQPGGRDREREDERLIKLYRLL
jgi:hypothetical protein